MNTRDFLYGYFYCSFKVFTQTYKTYSTDKVRVPYEVDNNLHRMYLMTPSGHIQFAINRGISHVDNNLVLPVFTDYDNYYDTCPHWCSETVRKIITEYLGENENWEYGEVRVTEDEMVEIIDLCGGIDFKGTIKHNIELCNTTFQDTRLKIS